MISWHCRQKKRLHKEKIVTADMHVTGSLAMVGSEDEVIFVNDEEIFVKDEKHSTSKHY